jgi:hypothetical protein
MRGAAMRLGRNAVGTVAFGALVLVGGAACADESAADAIAEKFSRAAEDSERREAGAKKAEAERASMAARKIEARRTSLATTSPRPSQQSANSRWRSRRGTSLPSI